jgi:hypothetical protein
MDGVLFTVKFDVILEEICITSCESQQAITQLDDEVENELTSSIADCSSVVTLQDEYQAAVEVNTALSNNPLISDTIPLFIAAADAATLDVTITVIVTTNSPSSHPRNTPMASPSTKLS